MICAAHRRCLARYAEYHRGVHQRTIGTLATSAVGIGEVRLATSDARGIPPAELERTLHHALERGLTFVEVADEEAAERMCGDAIRTFRLRDTAIVATQIGALEARGEPLSGRLPPRHVQERIEASLRATRLEVLPLAMLSLRTVWLRSHAWPELAGTLDRLVREGKVLQWGARLDLAAAEREDRLADELAAAAVLGAPFSAISIAFSACDRRGLPLVDGTIARPAAAPPPPPKPRPKPAGLILSLDDVADDPLLADPQLAAIAGLIPRASAPAPEQDAAPAKILPILAREPLAGGALAGTIGPGMKLAPRDDRHTLDDAAKQRIAIAVARLARLVRDEPPAARSCEAAQEILERSSRPEDVEASSLAELALRFILDRGALPLPRLHRREHVATATTAIAAALLSSALHEQILGALA